MTTIKSIIPEITYLTGATAAIIGMWSFMNWQMALIFAGAVLILASNYLMEVIGYE